MWQDMVPSPCTTKRTYGTCKAIRCRLQNTEGRSITCMLRTKVVNLLAMGTKVVLVLQDNPERRIVVIIRLLKQEGILCTNSLYGYCAWLYKARIQRRFESSNHYTFYRIIFQLQQVLFPCRYIGSCIWLYRFVRIDITFLQIINQ